MLSRLADRLILCPTTNPIEGENRKPEIIPTAAGEIEAWVTHSGSPGSGQTKPDLLAIKFPGTGGRAERGGPHPFELWPDRLTEIWTINHAGYGGSAGTASLKSIAPTCDAVWEHVVAKFPDVPIALIGNSLGCVSALYTSSRQNAAGIYLRNPVAIHQMISTRPRYNWWNFGLARLIANQIPPELDAVKNARSSNCQALFVRSERDRVTPKKYQRLIFDGFGGEKSEFVIEGARHHDRVSETQLNAYLEFLRRSGGFLSPT